MTSSITECVSCGAYGDEHFTSNDLGELICDLCGTHNFLYNQNETQDVDDAIGGITKSGGRAVVRRTKKRKKGTKTGDEEGEGQEYHQLVLQDCLRACQFLLNFYATQLVRHGAVPDHLAFPMIVKRLWIEFVVEWSRTGQRPLIHCFTDHISNPKHAERVLVQSKKIWNMTRLKAPKERVQYHNMVNLMKFNEFRYVHLFGLLLLACRRLSLGILPCDVRQWIQQGFLPIYHPFALLPLYLQRRVISVKKFFRSGGLRVPPSAMICSAANYLEHHMQLTLPPLNLSQLIHRVVKNWGLPSMVASNFLRLTGVEEPALGPLVDDTRPVITEGYWSATDVGAYLILAIQLCPSWHTWEHHLNFQEFHAPWTEEAYEVMPRKHLGEFTNFMRRAFFRESDFPIEFRDHIHELEQLFWKEENHREENEEEEQISPCDIDKTLPLYINGLPDLLEHENVMKMDETAYFFPHYNDSSKGFHLHAALTNLMDRLAEWLDLSPALLASQYLLLADQVKSLVDERVNKTKK